MVYHLIQVAHKLSAQLSLWFFLQFFVMLSALLVYSTSVIRFYAFLQSENEKAKKILDFALKVSSYAAMSRSVKCVSRDSENNCHDRQ